MTESFKETAHPVLYTQLIYQFWCSESIPTVSPKKHDDSIIKILN